MYFMKNIFNSMLELNKYFIVLLLLVMFFGACRKIIQSEFDDYNDEIVVNAILKADEQAVVKLSNTLSINGQSVNYLNDKVVKLYENGVFKEIMNLENNGEYKSDLVIQSGMKYKVEVEMPNSENLFADVEVPHSSELIGYEIIKKGFVEYSGVTYPIVKIKFKNPIDTIAYFQVVLYDIDEEEGTKNVVFLERIFDPVLQNEGVKIAVFSNEIIQNNEHEIQLVYSDVFCINCLIEFRRISYSYYKYLQSLALYQQNKNETANIINSPAFNLYSNVHNAFGILGAYSSVYSDTIPF